MKYIWTIVEDFTDWDSTGILGVFDSQQIAERWVQKEISDNYPEMLFAREVDGEDTIYYKSDRGYPKAFTIRRYEVRSYV